MPLMGQHRDNKRCLSIAIAGAGEHIQASVNAVYSAAYYSKKRKDPTFETGLDAGPSSMYLQYYLRGLQRWRRECDTYTVVKMAVVDSSGPTAGSRGSKDRC